MYSTQAAPAPQPDESRRPGPVTRLNRRSLANLGLNGAGPGDPAQLGAGAVVGTAELQALLLEAPGIEEFLTELAVLAACRVAAGMPAGIASGVSCGITMQLRRRPLTAASSDSVAGQLDEIQSGPCLAAMRTGQVVAVDDTAAEPRWPGFEARAAQLGVGSSLSVPLAAGGHDIGALNLLARTARAFGPGELRRAESFAATASGALTLAIRQAEQADLAAQLRATLTSRAVIDQALGIIMAQQRCTATEAFTILQAASQNRNVKLRQVAADIVTTVTGQPPQPPPFRDHPPAGS